MKLLRYSVLVAIGVALSACDTNTGGTPTTLAPQAYLRYVNAVSDLNTLDLRFYDQVQGSPNFTGVQFRQFTPYQGVQAGTRSLRAFISPIPYVAGATPARQTIIAGTIVDDSTYTLTAGTYYTIYHVGQTGVAFTNPLDAGAPVTPAGNVPVGTPSAAGTTMYLVVDAFPAVTNPPAATVQARVVNLGQSLAAAQGLGALDVFVARETDAILASIAAPNGATFLNVPAYPAAGSSTAYASLSTRAVSAAAVTGQPNCAAQTNTYQLTADPTGTVAAPALVSIRSCVIGIAGTTTVNGVGGAQVAGSVLTHLIFPAGVTGSAAAAAGASFANPLVVTMVDKNPPRTAP